MADAAADGGELRLVAGVHVAGLRPRRRRSRPPSSASRATLDNFSSVLDARARNRADRGAARGLSAGVDVPVRRHPRSLRAPAAARAPTASSPRAASSSGASCGWRSSLAWSTGSCSPTSTPGCSTTPTAADAAISQWSASAFFWRLALYAVFGALLMRPIIVFDYAKIRLVVEDRRSALGALSAALGIHRTASTARARPVRAERADVSGAAGSVGAWWRPAPAAPGASMWLAFAVAQLYLLARLVLKLQFMASQTALFQASPRARRAIQPRRCRCGPTRPRLRRSRASVRRRFDRA